VHFEIKEGDGRAYLTGHFHRELWEGGGTEEEIAASELRGRERESSVREEEERSQVTEILFKVGRRSR
jgi:hypothetical protein